MKNVLTLKRKVEQKVFLYVGDEEIEIVVTKVWLKSVSLAFKANRDTVRIVRDNAHEMEEKEE